MSNINLIIVLIFLSIVVLFILPALFLINRQRKRLQSENRILQEHAKGHKDFQQALFSIVEDAQKARDEAEKAEERFRLVVEAAPNSMIMINSGGKIVLANRQAEKVFGYTCEELMNQSIEILVPERFRVEHPGHRLSFYSNPHPRPMGTGRDLYGLRKDGSEVAIEIGLNPIRAQEKISVLASIVDITERKKAEEDLHKLLIKLQNANEKLKELDQMKSNFLMMASHELRTPLSSIKGYVSLLLQDKTGPISDVQRNFLTQALYGADRLHRLVNELLNLSKIESGQITLQCKSLNIEEFLKEEINLFRTEAEKRSLELELLLEKDLPVVPCDRDKIGEIIDNLLSNALKYTPKNGKIIVAARRLNKEVEIQVRDTGLGIPADRINRLFEPFYTIYKKGLGGEESVGLGLALVKKLVEMHQGAIRVQSEIGKGSIFTILLPI